MATYSEDWSGETDGVYPSVLTKRWVTTNETVVAANSNADGEDNFTFEQEWSVAARRLNEWTTVNDGNELNCEIVIRFKLTKAFKDDPIGIVLRGSGAAASETGYAISVNEVSGADDLYLRIYEYGAGSQSTLATSALLLQDYFWDSGDWFYLRARINGTAPATIQGRLWADRDPEPTAWHVTTTDSSITSAGWNGLFSLASAYNVEVDYMGGGTNGDTAPLTASTNTPVRVTAAYAATLYKDNTTPVRVSAAYAATLMTDTTTPVRVSAAYAAVLYKRGAGATNAVTQQVGEVATQASATNVVVRSTQQIAEVLLIAPPGPATANPVQSIPVMH